MYFTSSRGKYSERNKRTRIENVCFLHAKRKLASLRYLSEVDESWVEPYKDFLNDEKYSYLKKLNRTFISNFNVHGVSDDDIFHLCIYLNELISIEKIILSIAGLSRLGNALRPGSIWIDKSRVKVEGIQGLLYVQLLNRKSAYLNDVKNLDDFLKIIAFLPWHDAEKITAILTKY